MSCRNICYCKLQLGWVLQSPKMTKSCDDRLTDLFCIFLPSTTAKLAMWDTSSETPPISPQTARFMRRRSSAAHKALERDGSYYENLMLARNEADLEEAEKAFGWGGNAGAIRNASVRTHVRPFDLQEKARKHQCVGIEALIDPLDSTKRESGASEQAIETASSRKRWKLRLNICTSDSYFDDDCAPETGAPAVLAKSAIIVRQMEEARAARQAFLETRRARGSIMYDKVSGIAQIPCK